jgi:hypothetical protein
VETLELSYPEPVRLSLKPDHRAALKWVLYAPKRVKNLDLDRFLDGVAEAARVSFSVEDERRLADDLIMSWDQVRNLRAAGMGIGSHTRSHRVLQTLSVSGLMEELEGSRHDLSRELGEQPSTLAYPVGHSIAREPVIVDRVRAAGYEVGLSNATGTNRLFRRSHAFDLRRIAMDEVPHWMFRGMVALPSLLG